MSLPSSVPNVLGNTSLEQFDAVIIGSGAGGAAAAHVLTAAGLKVLILEAGDNYFRGLDDPSPGMPVPLYSNDEIKLSLRYFDTQDPIVEPRTLRASETQVALANPDVNVLSRTVGGTTVHADMKYPRFNEVDFRLASALSDAGRSLAGTSFADWPLTYDELEPFYAEAERLTGVAGTVNGPDADVFASRHSGDYPMPPSPPMYVGLMLADAARRAGYNPFSYPAGINSRPYDGRPPCVNCGFCSGYGCPNNSKGSAAVTTLRRALLTGNCQLRFNSFARRLVTAAGGRSVVAVEYVDDDGMVQTVSADRFILAASAMESARLCFLSGGLGNASDQLGRHILFHRQTIAVGIYKQRLHGERGQSITNGMSDFRGVTEGGTELASDRPLGGIIEFGTSSEPIVSGTAALDALIVGRVFGSPIGVKDLLVESPFHAHLAVMIMQAEDAPQATNRVDLDPRVRDVFGLPVVRLTYRPHAFELDAARHYGPLMMDVHRLAGAQFSFVDPTSAAVPRTRHVMGGLRMGNNPGTSVCDRFGRLHGADNLYCMDGGVFVTGSGYNPTLTIIALALRAAGNLVQPGSPERILS
jgi:choline dehydrogenase-like flavoprotein